MKTVWMLFLASIVILASMPAQSTLVRVTVPDLEALEEDQWTFVPPVQARGQAAQSTFEVIYEGVWPAEAIAAFEYAVGIWERILVSPIPIEVSANWTSFPSGALGGAVPFTTLTSESESELQPNTWYPSALINARSGFDIDPTSVDILSEFNSSVNWYFGTDGNPPSGTYDFVSVILHEIGHGLGIAGSFWIDNNEGSWGFNGQPFIYDVYVENSAQQQLINPTLFGNPSIQLATELTSNQIYFGGTNAREGRGGTSPQLYAPGTWLGGSSISHLNEGSYPAGSEDSLMTPQIGSAEAIHDPGPIARGILRDLGWMITTANEPRIMYLPFIQ